MTEEKITPQSNGWLMLSVSLLLLALSVAVFIHGVTGGGAVPIVSSILLLVSRNRLPDRVLCGRTESMRRPPALRRLQGHRDHPGISDGPTRSRVGQRSRCAPGTSTASD